MVCKKLAEAKLGKMLAEISKEESYKWLPYSGGRKPVLPEGISHKQSHVSQELNRNPEIIEEVIAEAIENEDMPTKAQVLKRGSLPKRILSC